MNKATFTTYREPQIGHPVPVPGKKTLVPDSASSEGRAIRQVEILSNKLLTTAFEASLECVTVICC